jgi:hypothetical protein
MEAIVSSIKELIPIDPKHPRRIGAIFDSEKTMDGIAEFTTIESAQDWRREMEGLPDPLIHDDYIHNNPRGSCSLPLSA